MRFFAAYTQGNGLKNHASTSAGLSPGTRPAQMAKAEGIGRRR